MTILDRNIDRLRYIDSIHKGAHPHPMSNRTTVEESVASADLVIGAVLVPGALAPHIVSETMVAGMRPGSVVVDISIDQGGCIETAHMTTHSDPTYVVHDVVHYCVGNMPGAVPNTSTYALTNATLPYVLELAGQGLAAAVARDRALAPGVNLYRGQVVSAPVAEGPPPAERPPGERPAIAVFGAGCFVLCSIQGKLRPGCGEAPWRGVERLATREVRCRSAETYSHSPGNAWSLSSSRSKKSSPSWVPRPTARFRSPWTKASPMPRRQPLNGPRCCPSSRA